MTPLIPTLLAAVLLAVPAAAQVDPFKGGVDAGKVKAVFNYNLPAGASLGSEVIRADEFYGDTLFGTAAQCVAAKTDFEPIKESSPYEWVELETGLHVLAKKDNAFQVYRFWVAASAKGKRARSAAKAKLKLHQDNLQKAVDAAKCP